jgi:hypothetical protein
VSVEYDIFLKLRATSKNEMSAPVTKSEIYHTVVVKQTLTKFSNSTFAGRDFSFNTEKSQNT